eukprot:GHVU01192349.1.p1 GENE.GHVU01192349.1~~GHVU01192349.1.p1  ORF type:complete len:301 (+),score=4.87 GHVU01192349.1:965-1867(+)
MNKELMNSGFRAVPPANRSSSSSPVAWRPAPAVAFKHRCIFNSRVVHSSVTQRKRQVRSNRCRCRGFSGANRNRLKNEPTVQGSITRLAVVSEGVTLPPTPGGCCRNLHCFSKFRLCYCRCKANADHLPRICVCVRAFDALPLPSTSAAEASEPTQVKVDEGATGFGRSLPDVFQDYERSRHNELILIILVVEYDNNMETLLFMVFPVIDSLLAFHPSTSHPFHSSFNSSFNGIHYTLDLLFRPSVAPQCTHAHRLTRNHACIHAGAREGWRMPPTEMRTHVLAAVLYIVRACVRARVSE